MNTLRTRRGVILITAIWVILALCVVALIFAREMRTEIVASGNRVSANQAATVELGAEQYVIAAVDACNGDAITVMQTPAEQLQIGGGKNSDGTSSGGGYFWILQTYFDNDMTYAFGITDENSKLNLNQASDQVLAALPGITQDIADSIQLWRGGPASATSGQGADSTYYSGIQRPYNLKTAAFESVDELYLLRNVTDTLMYGSDLDHNGMLDNNEQSAAGLSSAFSSSGDTSRGIFPFVTVWGEEANTTDSGGTRVNISTITPPATALRTLLTKKLPANRANQILERAIGIRTFRNIFDFAAKTQMQPSELAQVEYSLTATTDKTLPGLINVNTAPAQVLMCLPNLTQDDATAIVAARTANSPGNNSGSAPATSTASTNTSAAWIMSAVTPAKAAGIGGLITGRSFFYSADIVAAAMDGRSYKRVRIVVDARSSPPVIVYRKDLTYLGWPLDPAILAALKTHKPIPAPSGYGTGGANGLPQSL